MKRRISFLLVLCMMLSFCAFGAAHAMAEDWKLPEGTPMYEPGYVMETEFGTFTVLDVGFAKKITYLTENTVGDPPKQVAGALTSGDGFALLAVKGRLKNLSDSQLDLTGLKLVVTYGTEEVKDLKCYASLTLGQTETSTLEAGMEQDAVFASTITNPVYFGSMDLLISLSGSALGLRRSDLKSYISLGYIDADGILSAGDGVLTEDITSITNTSIMQPSQSATKQGEGLHVDELRIEDANMEYDPNKGYEYKCPFYVKIRLLYEIPEGCSFLRCYMEPQFLDAEGTVLPTKGISNSSLPQLNYESLETGMAAWNKTSLDLNPDKFDLVKSIRFSSYNIILQGTSGNVVVRGTLSEPIVFSIDELLAVNNQEPIAPAAEAEGGFVLRNGVHFGDSRKAVKGKEVFDLRDNGLSSTKKESYYSLATKCTVAGYEDVSLMYRFDTSDSLYEMDYWFGTLKAEQESKLRYDTLYQGLVKKYGEPMLAGSGEDGEVFPIYTGAFAMAADTISITQYTGRIGKFGQFAQWLVEDGDDYVKIDLVSWYYGSTGSLNYDLMVGYGRVTSEQIDRLRTQGTYDHDNDL